MIDGRSSMIDCLPAAREKRQRKVITKQTVGKKYTKCHIMIVLSQNIDKPPCQFLASSLLSTHDQPPPPPPPSTTISNPLSPSPSMFAKPQCVTLGRGSNHLGNKRTKTKSKFWLPCTNGTTISMVPTKKPPALGIPKNPPADTKIPPNMYQKIPPLPLLQWTSTNRISTKKNPFYQKKKLSSPCMLHLWTVVYQKANFVAPFHTNKPQDRVP